MNFREIRDGSHPEPLKPFLPEVDDFAKQIHFDIINPLLRYVVYLWYINRFTDTK